MNNETTIILKKILKFCAKNKFRSIILLTGNENKFIIENIHYLWIKSSSIKKSPILWCYRNQSKKSKKTLNSIENSKKKNSNKNFNINYCYYGETQKILGNSYGMCILEDFELVTPNILARIIETIEGGGIIILSIETTNSIKNLKKFSSNLKENRSSHFFPTLTNRFLKNLIFSVLECPSFVHLSEVKMVSKRNFKIIHQGNLGKIFLDPKVQEKKKLYNEIISNTNNMEPLTSLLAKTKTFDQARALLSLTEVISNKDFYSTMILTSSRGRGKSAVIGLAVAGAISYGISNIFVTSANPGNLNCFFAFLFIGFKILNYSEGKDFEIIQNSKLKYIDKVVVSVTHHQLIRFIPFTQVEDFKDQIELLVIDEAALIPSKELEKFDGPFSIFMSSTTSGYEGTGKEFNIKLIEKLKSRYFIENQNLKLSKKRLLKEIFLEEPIRYSYGDPVENWLNSFLCLEWVDPKHPITMCPDPRTCQLFLVDRNSLFSRHVIAKNFLQKIMSIFSSSHYRNSPDDLQILADAPSHRILILTSPLTMKVNFLPDILTVLHISYEGQISRVFLEKNLMNEKFIMGDLFPWVVSNHFQDSSFGELSGIRIVRISTQQDLQNMGYGTRALEILKNFCIAGKKKVSIKNVNSENCVDKIHKNNSELSALLINLEEREQPLIDYLGVSFSFSSKLLCFWLKNGFSLIILKPKKEQYWKQDVGIMIKIFTISTKKNLFLLKYFQKEFLREFLNLCKTDFRKMSTNLVFNVIQGCRTIKKKIISKKCFSNLDFKKLFLFSNNTFVSYKVIKHLIHKIAKICFWNFIEMKEIHLSELFILIAMGFQIKNFKEAKLEFNLKKHKLLEILKNILNKFFRST